MFKAEGILPALVTPFTDDGKVIDEKGLRALVDHCIELSVHGVVPCGSTGEFVNLTTKEKKQVIDIVIDEVNGRVPVVAGTGASGTDQALEMTKYAKDAGAEAYIFFCPICAAVMRQPAKKDFDMDPYHVIMLVQKALGEELPVGGAATGIPAH